MFYILINNNTINSSNGHGGVDLNKIIFLQNNNYYVKRPVSSTGSNGLSNQLIKSYPSMTQSSTYNVSWSPPDKHYPQTLITEEQRESGVMQVSNQKQNKAG